MRLQTLETLLKDESVYHDRKLEGRGSGFEPKHTLVCAERLGKEYRHAD